MYEVVHTYMYIHICMHLDAAEWAPWEEIRESNTIMD